MSPAPKSLSALTAVGLLVVCCASLTEAHTGHSHADIPSVLRHPFAGPEHLAISGAAGLVMGAAVLAVTRRAPMPALVRWFNAIAVALGVTLGVAAAI